MAIPAPLLEGPLWAASPRSVRAIITAMDNQLTAGYLQGTLGANRGALADAVGVGASHLVSPAVRVARRLGLIRPGAVGWRLTFHPDANGAAPTDDWALISAARADLVSGRLRSAEGT
jgi:hypothetical protein